MKKNKALEEAIERVYQTNDNEEFCKLSSVRDAYEETQRIGNEILTFDYNDLNERWVEETPGEFSKIVKALKKYGIKEFAVSPNLHIEFAVALEECGCKFEGFCKIRAITHKTPEGKEYDIVTAIKMSVN